MSNDIVDDQRPGAYIYFAAHGGVDNYISYVLYDEYDEATETGDETDLTGCSAAAYFSDDNGVVFSCAVDIPTGTDGLIEVQLTKTLAETHEKKGVGYGDSGPYEFVIVITWPSGLDTIEIYGPWSIGQDRTS